MAQYVMELGWSLIPEELITSCVTNGLTVSRKNTWHVTKAQLISSQVWFYTTNLSPPLLQEMVSDQLFFLLRKKGIESV